MLDRVPVPSTRLAHRIQPPAQRLAHDGHARLAVRTALCRLDQPHVQLILHGSTHATTSSLYAIQCQGQPSSAFLRCPSSAGECVHIGQPLLVLEVFADR